MLFLAGLFREPNNAAVGGLIDVQIVGDRQDHG